MTSGAFGTTVIRLTRAVALALAAGIASPAAAAGGAVIEVVLDNARLVNLPANVKTLIIGNPIIADVTLLKGGNTMVITGKGYGETNLIALDSDGKPLAESIIRVDAGQVRSLLVQRGFERETYYCNPKCHPTIALGDSSKFSGDIGGQIGTRNSLATSSGAATAAAGSSH